MRETDSGFEWHTEPQGRITGRNRSNIHKPTLEDWTSICGPILQRAAWGKVPSRGVGNIWDQGSHWSSLSVIGICETRRWQWDSGWTSKQGRMHNLSPSSLMSLFPPCQLKDKQNPLFLLCSCPIAAPPPFFFLSFYTRAFPVSRHPESCDCLKLPVCLSFPESFL